MGIPKLTTFMRECFKGWKEEELKGHLVIDGDALCYQLYDKFEWRSGGEYLEYRDHAIEYFRALQSSEIEPIVLFDGIDYTGKKADTIQNRYHKGVEELLSQFSVPEPRPQHLGNESASASETATDAFSPSGSQFVNHKLVLPQFTKKVLSAVLSELSIPYIVVDGEADDDIVRLANFHSCPVLSNDSDFYIYDLKGGFIHMEKFDWHTKPIISNVYYLRDMLDEFKLADSSLRFIIPAIFGNDFISAIEPDRRDFLWHIKRVTLLDTTRCRPTLPVIIYASHYDNLQDFIDRIASVEYLNKTKKKVLHENCLKSKEMYDIREESSLEDISCKTELLIDEEHDIPMWLLNQYRSHDTNTKLMFTIVLGGIRLSILVEDPEKPSSHCVSRPLRQAAYSIVGLESATEGTRIKGINHCSVKIPSCTITCDGQMINLDVVPTLPLYSKKKIIYFFLHSNMDLIELLDEKWRLVIASVVFWCERANVPLLTLKVLLLTFVICSSARDMIVELSKGIKVSPNFVIGPQWLSGLNFFAQWQCSYWDACSLNSVLHMPLQFYSPAFLYSGEFAFKLYFMSLSSNCDISSVLVKIPSESKALYDQLLTSVLSHKSVNCTNNVVIPNLSSLFKCEAVDYEIH